MPLEDDASIKSIGEVSRQVYISQKRKDQVELETMRRWGLRRMLYEESTQRRSPPLSQGRGVEVPAPDSYD